MKHIYFIFFILFCGSNLDAQENLIKENINVKSPDTYAFEKYGNIPINIYTGSLDLKIPIYKIDTKSGISINTILSYDSSGFIPHKKNNDAGYNWTLLAGGKVTRKVNGAPDEYIGVPGSTGSGTFNNSRDLHGFLHGVRLKPYSNSEVYNLNSGAGSYSGSHFWLGSSLNGYEGEPDEFSFNVLDISGSFMVSNDGTIKVQSDDPNIKVDLSGITTFSQKSYKCVPPKQEIKIIDGRGNIYIFGGDFSKYEVTYSRNNPYGGNKLGYEGFPIINAYSISKIIFAETKEEINFNYMEVPELSKNTSFCDIMISPQERLVENNPILFDIGSYTSTGNRIDNLVNCPGGVSCYTGSTSRPDGGDIFTLLKKTILSEIVYEKTTLKINYKDLGYSISHHLLNDRLKANETVIDNIEFYYDGTKIKTTNLLYTDLGGVNKRTFLTGIKKDDVENQYILEYANTQSFPTYYTKGIDHWGYWNGKNNTTLNPIDTYNSLTGDYTLNNTFRDTDPSKYNIGILSKIIYPTKGYTIFDYEVPNYGKRIERNAASQFLPTVVNINGIIGGARLSKKTDYSEVGKVVKSTRYKYTTSINNDESSGVLMNWPRYMYYFEFIDPGSVQKLMIITSNNESISTMDSYNIGYSKVFEIEEGNGYTEYEFYSYLDTPDVLQPEVENIKNYLSVSRQIIPVNLYKNFKNLYGIDKKSIRGKLKNKIIYDKLYTKKYEENITYTDLLDFNSSTLKDNDNYVSINHLTGVWVQGYRKFFNPNFIKNQKVTEYLNGGNIVRETTYNYNSTNHFQLTKQTTKNSKDEDVTTEYQYPSDLVNNLSYSALNKGFMNRLVTENRISEPVITQQKVGTISTSEVHNQYNDFSGILQKSAIHQKKGNGINIDNIVDRKIKYDSYDDKGNLTQYTLENGIPISIIWGYNGQYPVAKIEGSIYTNVIRELSDYLTKIQNGTLTVAEETIIRGLIPTSMITTYQYKPLIGVTKIVQPNGLSENYKYDSANRLEEIRNDKGELLKSFKYNYKQ